MMDRRSTRGQLARYRKQLQYEEELDFQRYMRFALYLRLFTCNFGVLYNPYDTDFAGLGVFLNWALRLDLGTGPCVWIWAVAVTGLTCKSASGSARFPFRRGW
jgi:hypothetical protein